MKSASLLATTVMLMFVWNVNATTRMTITQPSSSSSSSGSSSPSLPSPKRTSHLASSSPYYNDMMFQHFTLPLLLSDEEASSRFDASVAACPPQPAPMPLSLSPLPSCIISALASLDTVMNQTYAATKLPGGVSIGVVYDQTIIHTLNLGYKNKDAPQVPPDENTIFRIGSVTKLFSSISLYQMIESGVVASLDDPISKYWPNMTFLDPFTAQDGNDGHTSPTFIQLATHLSGAPREAPCIIVNCNLTNEEMLPLLQQTMLIYPPFTQPSYSNLGYSLLGNTLGAISSSGYYQQMVQDQILTPLAMKSTGFTYSSDVVSRMAVGYDANGNPQPLYLEGWGAPAGQAYSTISDLSVLVSAHLSDYWSSTNRLMSASQTRQYMMPRWIDPDYTVFGSPWESAMQNNYLVRRKGGNFAGFSGMLSLVPELKIGFVALFSNSFDEFAFADAAWPILIDAFVQTYISMQPPIPSPQNTSLYAGVYTLNGNAASSISIYNGQYGKNILLINILGMNVFLSYITPTRMAVYIPPGLEACMLRDTLAIVGQYVFFNLNEDGSVQSFTVPGFVPGAQFIKKVS
eukprot:TRINITY_DN4654_c0_g1_i3.p1 TRINITY_DN4654_c0_g1~~TRINITY_DN4654_c0_g1_i3.p1  ORF type:complete len:606 (+),score=123.90 TRINITY_DN4654_c0_g1_i3:99-1820(+)